MRVTILSQLWRADWHLSVLLGLLLLVVFVLFPMSARGPLAAITLQSFISLVVILGAVLIARRGTAFALVALLGLGTAVIGWIRLYSQDGFLTVLGLSTWILFLILLAAAILIRVFDEGRITVHRIQGALAVYLLLGVIWSGCYRLVMEADPGAFNLPSAADEGTLMSKLVYFSFATLTTVGYGDVTALDTAARSLAMLEALTGQLFPAVLIARLVSMEVSHREKG
jgi:Ion channel